MASVHLLERLTTGKLVLVFSDVADAAPCGVAEGRGV
jgi:hypothetical protein